MPCGEYFTSFNERMSLVRWRIEKVALIFGVIPLAAPFVLSPGQVSLLTGIFITAIAVLGLNVILGYAGEIVLAQGAFMAIGAYTTSQLLGTGIGLLPSMIGGGLIAALIAIIFGLPSFRVKGFYIAITTLALQFISEWFFQTSRFDWLHGGSQQTMPYEAALVGDMLMISSEGMSIYFFAFALLVLFALASFNISRTAIGRAFRAVHNNDLAAAVLGIDVYKNKLMAFGIGGFIIGFAGGVWGFYLGFVSAEFFTLELTIDHYVMLLFGGLGYVWGAILGTGVVTILLEVLRGFVPILSDIIPGLGVSVGPIRLVVFGIVIIAVLAIEPKGLMAALGKIKEYLRKWPYAY